MLGHAWAEVEHDIIYKINSSFDTAPQDEMVLLDGLNGMVRCSELLLDQLHQLWKRRTESRREPFANSSRFGEHFTARIDKQCFGGNVDDRRLKILWDFLKVANVETLEALDTILDELGLQNGKCPKCHLNDAVERYQPFQLDPAMQIPFCVMEHILSNILLAEEVNPQHDAAT